MDTGSVTESSEAALDDLLDALRLRPAVAGAELAFAGRSTTRNLPFVFGGQLVAQALAAAYATVRAPLRAHALHGRFLAPADPLRSLRFDVELLRDGRASAHRQVRIRHDGDGAPMFTASMAFGLDHESLGHAKIPGAAIGLAPRRLPPLDRWLSPHADQLPAWWGGGMPIDLRYREQPPHVLDENTHPRDAQSLWMRTVSAVPDDPRLHDCLLAYASDLTLLDAVLLRHARSWYTQELRAASLDHSIWFHRPIRMDDWALYEQSSPAAHSGRGLALGDIFSSAGVLCASVAQQGMIRLSESMPTGRRPEGRAGGS